MSSNDKAFTGSIPKVYEDYLVPLIFEDYARDIAGRAAARLALSAVEGSPKRVLEIAAGTGAVTRALVTALPASTEIVATDLNPAMIAQAQARGTSRPVQFQTADALQLPFPDQSVDAVVIQFGVMFFPDKAKAHAEARRVLRPGGALIFSVWDRIADNEVADAIEDGLAALFPSDPPRFLSRAPYGYFDHATIAHDVAAAGFTAKPSIDTVTFRSRAMRASDGAIAFCQGSPLRGEIEARGALQAGTDAATAEIARRFSAGPIDARIQAIVVTVTK